MEAEEMYVEVIDRIGDFKALRGDWDRVYASDDMAQVYLSWSWMAQWLPLLEKQWFVLAAKVAPEDGKYVAFFPLRARTHIASNGGFFTELAMAGNRFADYTGFICDPEFREAAITAFGKHLRKMHWAAINFESVRVAPDDMRRLLNCFSGRNFTVEARSMMIGNSDIDNSICPYVDLPEDWDAYLSGLSSNTRQKLRRLLRKVENSPELRVVHANAETIEDDIETLVKFWKVKWAAVKGDKLPSYELNLRSTLRLAFNCDMLLLPVLYDGSRAVGAHGLLVDRQKKSFNFVVGSRDPDYTNPQPGLVLHADTIRHAIGEGFTKYDFLRGNEAYKYSFGSKEWQIFSTVVKRKRKNARQAILEQHSLPEALARVRRFHADGKAREAEIGYRQILKIDPRCAPALYGYGGLKMAQGEPTVAEAAFRSLLAVTGNSEKAWLALGNALAAQNRWTDAEAARQRAMASKLTTLH